MKRITLFFDEKSDRNRPFAARLAYTTYRFETAMQANDFVADWWFYDGIDWLEGHAKSVAPNLPLQYDLVRISAEKYSVLCLRSVGNTHDGEVAEFRMVSRPMDYESAMALCHALRRGKAKPPGWADACGEE